MYREKGKIVFLSVVVIILNAGIRKIYSIIECYYVTRQQVAFSEECRKIKGFGSLRVDFYTRFKPKNKDLGL